MFLPQFPTPSVWRRSVRCFREFSVNRLCLATFVAILGGASAQAEESKTGKLIFEDRFERNESQEQTDEVGNGWKTNSKSRANGHKQVDLKDGTMRIFIHETADHGVSVTQPMAFRDGRVELKFMLEDPKDSLGLNFADLQYKKVWAGHLFRVNVGIKAVEIADLKTGVMDLKTRNDRKAGTVSEEVKEMLKTKTKRVPNQLETGKWYHVAAEVVGDTMTVSIDGDKVASFASEGMAHPTKRLLRLAIKRNVVVDDLQIYSLD
jgi:hypothetical protein